MRVQDELRAMADSDHPMDLAWASVAKIAADRIDELETGKPMPDVSTAAEIMRDALAKIAQHGVVNGKPTLTRREMQAEARQALIACGHRSWAEKITGVVSVLVEPKRT